MFISNSGVNSIEDDVEESEFDNWIYPTTDGGPSNYTTKENKFLTGAGKLNPGLMWKSRASFPLGMMVARIPVGEDDFVGE